MTLVRPLLFAAILLVTPALSGCVISGPGLCIGQPTPLKLIRDDQCPEWVIEIDHVSGMAPDREALDFLKDALEEVVRKDSIRIIIDQTGLQGRDSWTSTQLDALEQDTRDHVTGGNVVVTHILYVDGELATNPKVVGFAHGSQYLVMFKQNIKDATTDDAALDLVATTETQYERSVLVHEFGHALGLVNNGIPMQQDHEADRCDTGDEEVADDGHSVNQNSVMFCTVNNVDAFNAFFQDEAPPSRFDANDKADICAAGGRC